MLLKKILMSSSNLPKVTGLGPFRDSIQATLAGGCSSILKLDLPKFGSIKLQALQVLAIQGEYTVSDESCESSAMKGFVSIQATRPTAMYLAGNGVKFHIEKAASSQSWKVLHHSLIVVMSDGLTPRASDFCHELQGLGVVVFQAGSSLESICLQNSECIYVERHLLVATTASYVGNILAFPWKDNNASWISLYDINVKRALDHLRKFVSHMGLMKQDVQKDLDKSGLMAASKTRPSTSHRMASTVRGNLCKIHGPAKIILKTSPDK